MQVRGQQMRQQTIQYFENNIPQLFQNCGCINRFFKNEPFVSILWWTRTDCKFIQILILIAFSLLENPVRNDTTLNVSNSLFIQNDWLEFPLGLFLKASVRVWIICISYLRVCVSYTRLNATGRLLIICKVAQTRVFIWKRFPCEAESNPGLLLSSWG